MAKPIIVIKVYKSGSKEAINNIVSSANKIMGDEYYILVVACLPNKNDFEFECHNDCKGLPDIDIEKLIKDFYNDKQRTLPV